MRCCVCGKDFDVLYPDLWRFRNKNRWFCSWGCLRADEKKKGSEEEMARMKKDGTPAAKPGRKPAEVRTVEKVPEVKIDGAMKIDGPEVELVTKRPEKKPMTCEGFKVTAIAGDLGEYYFDRKYRTIDFRNIAGDEVSMTPEEWKQLAEEIPKMMKILGVEV